MFNILGNTILNFLQNIQTSLQISLANIPTSQILLFDIGIVIIIATVFAFISRGIKQEIIPAYIIAGLIIGPIGFGLIKNISLINVLSEIGIAFLLFVAGLEISLKKLKELGKTGFSVGLIEMLIIVSLGFIISLVLGFYRIEALYIALIISFSSTVVVVKLLADKRELNTVHARIILGILVLQDIIAIIVLSILTTTKFSFVIIFSSILKIIFLILISLILKKTVLDKIFKYAAKSTELLLLTSIAFIFVFALISQLLGLSIIIGAFVIGVALANSQYKIEIEGKIRPLRDFFATIFFVTLGMQLTKFNFSFIIIPLLIFLGIVLIIKPLITIIFVRFFGYKKRTSFLSGISIAQISEFSLILSLQGLMLGHISTNIFNITVMLAIITIGASPYLIKYSNQFYKISDSLMNLVERFPKHREQLEYKREGKKIILFGCHRTGTVILKHLKKYKNDLIVVDYNPDIIKALIKQKISCVYGDIGNPELLEMLHLKKTKIAISTIGNLEDNLLLIEKIKEINPKIFIFVTATKIHDALELYKKGADYVNLPAILAGEKTLDILKILARDSKKLEKIKKEQINYLKKLHHYLY